MGDPANTQCLDECVASLLGVGIRETIVTAGGRIAPLGAELSQDLIVLRPYFNSRIGWAIIRSGTATVNMVSDSIEFYRALTEGLEVDERGVVKGAGAYIVAHLVTARVAKPRMELKLRPSTCVAEARTVQAYSRANTLLLEILVRYTRIPLFLSRGWGLRALKMYEECLSMARTIERVAPGSGYSRAASRIVERMATMVEQLVG